MSNPAPKNEVPIDDAELEQLMADLETEVAAAGTQPTIVAAAPAPTPAPAPVAAPVAPVAQTLPVADDPSVGAPTPPAFVMPDWSAMTKDQANEALRAIAGTHGKESVVFANAKTEAQRSFAARAATPAPAPAATSAPVEAPAPAVEAPAPAVKPALSVVAPAAPAEGSFSTANDQPEADKPRAAGLQFHIDVAQFKSETAINDTNIDQAFMEQSSLRATYAEQAARAEAQASRVKMRFEVKEAELYDLHRKTIAATGEKVTEKAVENAVKLDPNWAKAKNAVIESETIAAILKNAVVGSLNDRRDMLIQLGADRREDGKGAMRMLAMKDAERDLRQRAQDAARRDAA